MSLFSIWSTIILNLVPEKVQFVSAFYLEAAWEVLYLGYFQLRIDFLILIKEELEKKLKTQLRFKQIKYWAKQRYSIKGFHDLHKRDIWFLVLTIFNKGT